MKKRHASVFSGVGGFELAAEWMGWENVFHCEINPFGRKVLKYYWPDSISYEDITKTDFTKHRGTIDILTGGFPCQGFSLAGNRFGTEDYRYLWPAMLRVIKETKPRCIIGENVAGITTMEDKSGVWKEVFAKVESRKIVRYDTIDDYEAVYTRQAKMLVSSICEDLEKEGYSVQPVIIPAASVGAPHRRDRIWFIAYSNNAGTGIGMRNKRNGKEEDEGWEKQPQPEFREAGKYASDSSNERLQRGFQTNRVEREKPNDEQFNGCSREWFNTWEQFPTESPICSGNDGLSTKLSGITFSKWRTESIKAFGNGVVWQVVYEIFEAIEAYENL